MVLLFSVVVSSLVLLFSLAASSVAHLPNLPNSPTQVDASFLNSELLTSLLVVLARRPSFLIEVVALSWLSF